MDERFTVFPRMGPASGRPSKGSGALLVTVLSLSSTLQLTFRPEAGRPGGPGEEGHNPPLTALCTAGDSCKLTVGGAAGPLTAATVER